MDINITISDEQGAAIAQAFRITRYTDGRDLIQKVADAAMLVWNKKQVIGGISATQDAHLVEAVVTAYNASAATPLPQPALPKP